MLLESRRYAGEKGCKGLEVAVVANWQFHCLFRRDFSDYIRTVRFNLWHLTIDRYSLGDRPDRQADIDTHCRIYYDFDVASDRLFEVLMRD
jgi:hypothetical protein